MKKTINLYIYLKQSVVLLIKQLEFILELEVIFYEQVKELFKR